MPDKTCEKCGHKEVCELRPRFCTCQKCTSSRDPDAVKKAMVKAAKHCKHYTPIFDTCRWTWHKDGHFTAGCTGKTEAWHVTSSICDLCGKPLTMVPE